MCTRIELSHDAKCADYIPMADFYPECHKTNFHLVELYIFMMHAKKQTVNYVETVYSYVTT